jgi:hypothetical protein
MVIKRAMSFAVIVLLAGCAASPGLDKPPDDLQHAKPVIEGGGGY